MTKRYVMLIKNDAAANNNKFYEIKLEDNDEVMIRYGRVGATGASESKGFGEATFEKVLKAKTGPKKGYQPVDVVVNEGGTPTTTSTGGSLVEIAMRDVAGGNADLRALLTRLNNINRFQLQAASGGQIDIVDGEVKTALGVLISLDSISTAKDMLNELSGYVEKKDFSTPYVQLLQNYLTKIPQKVSHRRGWDQTFFTEHTTLVNQMDLLEQLENSVKNSKPVEVTEEQGEIARLFGYSLEVVQDGAEFEKLRKFYNATLQSKHVSSSKKLVRVYKMINPEKDEAYRQKLAKIGNEMMLWHGTRACNVLSILKGGLIIPPTVGGNFTIAGRMFGDGVYFSDQSSKSLNYSVGYWGRDGVDNGSVFMLNASVAMGKAHTPSRPISARPSGFDSIYAVGGKSGVMNNEMIVPHLDQFRLDFLCEFE